MARLQKIPTLSIIIPTLNEASRIPLLLSDLMAWPYNIELVIVDGGSKDLTVLIIQINGFKVIRSLESNRGKQMKIGAQESKGEWLLFLHADSRLDKKWVNNLIKIFRQSSSKEFGWYFDFRVNKNKIQFKILEFAVAIRSHFLQLPYGDQGLLIHKDLYNYSGGFSSLKLMEDIDLIKRITKTNQLKRIGLPILTDSKKWKNTNIIERAILNAKLRNKWKKGYNIDKLVEEYYS